MTGFYGVYAIILLISTIITLYLAFYSWNRRSNPNALYFSFLMLAVSIWSITGAFEMATVTFSIKILWSQLSYIGIAVVGPFWLLFTLTYTNNDQWLQRKFIAILMIIPVIILILVATNSWHGLIWPTITPSSSQPGAILIYGHGTGFYLNALYTYILMFIGLILLIQFLIQSPKLYQKQIFIVLIAAIVPIIANVLYIIQESPVEGLDPTPFAFTITGILIGYSIFRYKLLDIVPVAYNNLFTKLSSGVLVINSQKRIVDINPTAEELLGIKPEIIGSLVEEKLNQFRELYPLDNIKSEIKKEIKIKKPPLWLDIQIISLDKKEQRLGWLITFSNISARKKAESSLKKSEKEYRDLVASSLIGIYKTDLDGKLLFANNALLDIFGYNKSDDISNLMISSRYKNLDERKFILKKLKEEGKIKEYEVELLKKSQEPINILLSATMDGNTISGMIMDITESKKAEKQIKSSLLEKEMLLKEIHHRVKNNLMIISSLLNLQSRYIKDEASKNIFKESQNRARSMALIHELLYRSTDLKRIDFGYYIRTLTKELFNMYVTDQSRIKLNMDVEDVMVDINTAIPLGLIVNELVSNSMKHAFPNEKSGEIYIEFKSDKGKYTMVVADNGVGFPENYDIQNTDTLGLRIVNSLTEQIEGKIRIERDTGTKFTIEFQEENYENDY
jgi:PAS domain S-box-containing protein